MKTLGAVLAGGQSTRFGSDKAEALHCGAPLIAHVLRSLRQSCTDCVVVGRTSSLASSVPDWPAADLGPLGGLAGALRYAKATGFTLVLSVPVDCVRLPAGLLDALAPGPACVADCPVMGLWPVSSLDALLSFLDAGGRSVRAFADMLGAGIVSGLPPVPNVNTPGDLERLETSRPAARARAE